jgi:serine/threonine protein phosphatase 1
VTQRLFAIGDIHGCLTALNLLLAAIEYVPSDAIVLLGDYVDRGPDSCGVIDRILQLKTETNVHAVLGNHDEMLLSVLDGQLSPQFWIRHGATPTLDSYGFAGDLDAIPVEHVEFLRNCPALLQTDQYFFTHANYDERVPLDQQDPTLLRWTSLDEHTPGPHESGKIAVVGHTADRSGEVFDLGYLKCVDTFCYGGQWLTALELISGKIWQTNELGELRTH